MAIRRRGTQEHCHTPSTPGRGAGALPTPQDGYRVTVKGNRLHRWAATAIPTRTPDGERHREGERQIFRSVADGSKSGES